jgi:NifU-like protein involved in Fe-S cluster formation
LGYDTKRHVVSISEQPLSDYSESFLEHYRRPRNLGDLAAPDAIAIAHDATCGDVLRLALKMHDDVGAENGRIRAMRFKAYGCAATIAVGSVLTELVTDRLVREAEGLTAAELVEALGGLPPGRVHAADLGCEALRMALGRLRRG